MGRKKKGYQQSLGEVHGSSKAVKAILKGNLGSGADALITLENFDISYLEMIKVKAKTSDESQILCGIIDTLLQNKSLLKLRDDMATLSQKSQGGSFYSQKSVAELACLFFLGQHFSQIKKYVQAILLNVDEKQVLNTLENIIIEFACSDDFEERTNNLAMISDLMRAFEYKLMAYFELYHRLIEQNPLAEDDEQEEDQIKKDQSPKYEVQPDFQKIVQTKISAILNNQRISYLAKNQYVMNHYSTKALVEFLHAYLNFITRFNDCVDLDANIKCIEFVGEQLNNAQCQRDILTQSSIIYWTLLKKQIGDKAQDANFALLLECLTSTDPAELFANLRQAKSARSKTIQKSLLSMAKIRGYVLTLDKHVDLSKILTREIQGIEESAEAKNLAEFILANCEKNEGLQKLYSFHTLDSILCKSQSIDSNSWLQKVSKLLMKNMDYPLHSIQNCCEAVMRKILHISTKDQIKEVLAVVKTLNSKHEIKSKFITLNVALEHIDSVQFLKDNSTIVKEMIYYSTETVVCGKYVLTFFEQFLRKLMNVMSSSQQEWFDAWTNEYLEAIQSGDEALRQSVCSYITPIVIKINKMSLPYILSRFLQQYQATKNKSIGALSSLMSLLKVARQNKMIVICDDTQDIRLEANAQQTLSDLQQQDTKEFSILQKDLLKLVLTQNWKMSLECFLIVTQESKSTSASVQASKDEKNDKPTNIKLISSFEYEMCETFIKNCVRTTFPEHRQNFMKAIRSFMMRLRSVIGKDIKKYVDEDQEKSEELQHLIDFLRNIISFCEQNLYTDKPIETALPLYEILMMIQDLFGDFDYQLRVTQILPAFKLLSKEGLMESKDLIIYLLNSLKSSWALVRLNAFYLLTHMPDDHKLLTDKDFVNQVLMNTAMSYSNNPKAMVAEGSGLLLKLVFIKCLSHLDIVDSSQSIRDQQLAFCQYILKLIKDRLVNFQTTLLREGKTQDLLHGLMSFFKNLFQDFKISRNDLSQEQFEHWRVFFNDLMTTCLQISNTCSRILSNNRLQMDDDDISVKVDCRGHPITGGPDNKGAEEAHDDYDNLVLVGVWLAVKENGQALYNLLRWLQLPTEENDNTKFIQDKEIKNLCESLLTMLFEFKHRGAIDKAAESFSLISNKLLCSNMAKFQKMPQEMLTQAFERITNEDHSTVLRRSAGIPPIIISILRSEPLSNQPVLLNQTLEFLLNLAKTSTDEEDSKIHALNIMRFIFQDALLKHDIGKFVTPAMILSVENFKSDNWSIRNSALMCFTSLTKRMLNTTNVQEQDLSRKKGLSIWEFVSRYEQLSDFFKLKLKECAATKGSDERQDMVIFSILLFISRLIPSFQLIDSKNLASGEDDVKEGEEPSEVEKFSAQLQKSREQSMHEYIGLIKAYAKSGTYFVRKISAQALLPLISFDDYFLELKDCLERIEKHMMSPEHKLRQNEAHGIMVRFDIFLHAYYTYRDLNHSISGRSDDEESAQRKVVEHQLSAISLRLLQFFNQNHFESYLDPTKKVPQALSKVTMALFNKSHRLILKRSTVNLDRDHFESFRCIYQGQLNKILEYQLGSPNTEMKPDLQVFLKDLMKTVMVIQAHPADQNLTYMVKVIKAVLSNDAFLSSNIDLAVKMVKSFKSKIKLAEGKAEFGQLTELSQFLVSNVIVNTLVKNDERYCKLLEFSLKLVHRIKKHSAPFDDGCNLDQVLEKIIQNFEINSQLVSMYIKIMALTVDCNDPSQIQKISSIFRKYSYADQEEKVRVATVKSVSRVLENLDLKKHMTSCLDIFMTIILILNDEHPEIRSYFVQSEGAKKLAQQDLFSLESESLVDQDQYMVVDLNEQVLTQSVFHTAIKNSKTKEDKVKVFEFLMSSFIFGNPYREHNAKNFDDKIFFYEPINKYYDLLWVKRQAYQILIQHAQPGDLVIGGDNQIAIESVCSENMFKELSETGIQLENKVESYMLFVLRSIHKQPSTSSMSFLKSLNQY